MPGETSLSTLLRTLKVTLHPATFVFVTIPNNQISSPLLVPFKDIQMSFRESEGLTLILDLDIARIYNYEFQYPSRMIILDVHSSLEAVGFMAVIAARLAAGGISSNPVSAFYHDHLFVPTEKGEAAVRVLQRIAEEANLSSTD